MSDPIYLVGQDDELTRVERTVYKTESELQRLIDRHPELIPGGAIDDVNPRRWLVLRSEAGVPSEEGGGDWWSVDHLLVDQEGVPTFVEVKRSTDTRVRREVVAQMLEYAANGTAYWRVETLRGWFEEAETLAGGDPEAKLSEFLSGSTLDTATFWDRVAENLQAARVRCVFVADDIPPTLRRLVEFMNEHLDTVEVLAVELPQYVGAGESGLRAIVPRLVGQTAKAQAAKSGAGPRPSKQWDETSFLDAVEGRFGEDVRAVCSKILAWANLHADRVDWGRGAVSGSMIPVAARRVFFTVWTSGTVEVAFQYLAKDPAFSDPTRREELRQRLNSIPGISIAVGSIALRPPVPLAVLRDDDALDRFFAVFEWVIATLRQESEPENAAPTDASGDLGGRSSQPSQAPDPAQA